MRFLLIVNFFLLIIFLKDGHSNVVGVDLQNFNPNTGGIDCVTVQSSETLTKGVFNFGFFINYSENSIPYYYEANDGSRKRIQDTILSADFNFGIGLAENLDAGMSFPRILKQTVKSEDAAYQYSDSGSTEVRINSKYRFYASSNFSMAVLASVNMSLIINNPYNGYNSGPIYNLELIFDKNLNNLKLISNLGYRLRNPGEQIENTPVRPIKDQFIASLGSSYLFKSIDTKLIFELFGSLPAQKVQEGYNRAGESLECLLGLKFDILNNFSIHAGGGTRILTGNSSPAWRAYTGLNLAMGPTFSKPPKIERVRSVSTRAVRPEMQLKDLDPFANPPTEAEEIFVARDALFEFDSHMLEEEARILLERLVKYMTQKPGYKKLFIDGHTDSIGSESYNLSLSKLRAENVKKYLIEKFKLTPSTLFANGYGASRPIASNGSYQGRKLNRRVEFKVVWK